MTRIATHATFRLVPALWRAWLLASLVGLLALPATAQQKQPADTAAATASADATLVVQHRTVTVFRVPFLGVSPADRAHRAETTIDRLLDQGGPGALTTQSAPQGNVVMLDGSFAFILVPEDADTLTGQTLQAITDSAVRNLQHAIAETREARDRGRLLRAAVESIVATLVFGLVVWLLWRARLVLFKRATDLLAAKASDLHPGVEPLLHRSRLRGVAMWVIRVVGWLVLAILFYEWLVFLLTRFAYTRAWGEELGHFLLGVAQRIGGGVLHALPDLIIALVVFLLARSATGALRAMFDRIERGEGSIGGIDRDLAGPTRRIVNILVWLFALAMAYPYLPGSQSEAFKGISVLAGLMITLGGSSLIGQAASGLILMYSRTLRVGEYVRISDQEGTVTELGTFTTKIRTGLGEEISLPNAVIMGAVTKNYSRTVSGRGYILDTVLTIGYDTPWRQVEAMLTEAAGRTDGVLASPPPRVFKTGLSDFYVEYRLVCQAVPSQPRPRAEVLHVLHSNVLDVFNEHGVQIMSPHYLGDPQQAKVVPPAGWFAPPAQRPAQPTA